METSIIRSNEEPLSSHTCFGCNQPIIDQYLSKVLNRLWHEKCIRCDECQMILNGKCFTRNNRLFCKPDFYRLFGVKCAGCKGGIYPSDMVRRLANRIFHAVCLKCQQCGKEVATGDQLYVIQDGLFVCKMDYENIMNGTYHFKGTSSPQKPSPQSATESDELDDKPPSTSSLNEQQMSDDEDDANKRRGPRTTIKAKQLEVLKSAFLATPKPSRHIREKLAADTGLTMRVIQVWFQNRRSKERRVKQMSVQDVRRGFRKNSISKAGSNGMGFTYFPGGATTPGMDYSPNTFNYDAFSNNSNNITTTNKDNNDNNNNNNNNLPLALPTDILQSTTNAVSKYGEESSDFHFLNSITSQLQCSNFNAYNSLQSFTGQMMPTYERL